MLPSSAEIARSVQGAWLLAQGDTRGLDLFDLSIEGFWRSFAAALLVAPAYLLLLVEQYATVGWPQQTLATVVAELVAYGCGWLSFPLAAIFLTRLLGLGARYVPLVVAVNWSAMLQITLYTAVVVLGLLLPGEVRTMLLFTATLVVLGYQWFVIRTALVTSGTIAFGLVVIDVLLSIATSRAVDGLLQPG